MARTIITTLSSRQSTLEGSKKTLKGADLKKITAAVEKIDQELENARNGMTIAESQCNALKEDISKVTGVVVQFNQEWKYYTTIITTIKKEIEEAEKAELKQVEEDAEEEKDDKKDDKKKDDKKEEKEEKEETKEEKKEEKKKEKIVTSSTTNEVKQIETREETTVTVVTQLVKELEETESTITTATEEVVKMTSEIVVEEGEAKEEKADLEKVTRRRLRQRCAVKFPAVFTQFSKARSLKASGMCPCQGGSTGTSQISLGIEAPEEADKVVQSLFLKKLASEAKFLAQVQRTAVGGEGKLVVEGEKERMTLVIVTSDDKVTAVLTELEEAELTKKGSAIVSPLL